MTCILIAHICLTKDLCLAVAYRLYDLRNTGYIEREEVFLTYPTSTMLVHYIYGSIALGLN